MGEIRAGGRPGRPAKPMPLKILHGDYVPKSHRGVISPSGAVVPPALTKPGREMWDLLAPDMIRTGVLTSWDVPIFGEFCEALILAKIARLTAMKEAAGQIVPIPGGVSAITGWLKAMTVINSLSGRFGMTPSDRARLGTIINGDTIKTSSSGEDLLSG